MDIKRSILLRVRLVFLCVVAFAICVTVRIGYVQFVEGEKWARLGEEVTFSWRTVKPTRGNIYSDNGSLLATSLPFYRLAMDPTLPSEKDFRLYVDSLAMRLADHFGDRSAREYREMMVDARAAGRQYILLNRKQINHHTRKGMLAWPLIRKGRYKGGVIFEKTEVRYRPFSNLSRRTIGFVNENGKGAGLEYSFNSQLGGQDGEALFQKIGGGTWKPVFDAENKKAVEGFDIQTTLDVNLQDVAETSLHRAMATHQADQGTVVVMEVKTGEIRAISNLTREGDHYSESFNHAVRGLFEPGSTFKLLTTIALLEGSPVRITDSIATGNGIYRMYGVPIRDHEEGGLGTVSVQKAFEHSSNIAMAKLVSKHYGSRPAEFFRFVDDLGMSRPLGLQMSGEAIPRLTRPTDKSWSGITLAWMAHGYGFEITPLHTLALFNAVANDGRMIKPKFVRAIMQADQVVQEFETETINPRICSDKTLKNLRTLLEGVVERGTAQNLRNTHCRIAGKTGTAQILENGRYVHKYITSFAGYFPAENPKYTAIVLIRNPRGNHQTGNSVAGPVFRDIAENIYAQDLGIQPALAVEKKTGQEFPVIKAGRQEELAAICKELGIPSQSSTDEEWIRAARNGSSVVWRKAEVSRGRVPNVSGMTFRDAVYLLEKEGLMVEHSGHGRVVQQSLSAGTAFSRGARIQIKLDI